MRSTLVLALDRRAEIHSRHPLRKPMWSRISKRKG
jgi:hypothetical protein